MSKITLTDLANLENQTTAVSAINTNNAILETALTNTLSRDGTAPNQMGASLDMNSNRVLNLPVPLSNYEPLRVVDVNTINGSGITVSPLPAGGTTGQVIEKNSSTNFDVSWKDSGAMPVGGTTNQLLKKNSSTTYDASWATISGLPVGGLKNQVLSKNSTTDDDVSWTYGSGYAYNPKNYGAVGNGVTDDYAAINACITAAVAAGAPMVVPSGTYAHSGTITWAYPGFKVICLDSAAFLHTGTGIAHNFDGLVHGTSSQGVFKNVFGGPNRFSLRGNPSGGTTKLAYVSNWHNSEMKIRGRDAQYILFGENHSTGVAGAVSSTFDVQCSANADQTPFTVHPDIGIFITDFYNCIFPKPIIEDCGHSGDFGVKLISCGGCMFEGGTFESNTNGGVVVGAGCSRNLFLNMDIESNGASYDIDIIGNNTTFLACSNGGTASGAFITSPAAHNKFINCNVDNMTVQSGAISNSFDGCSFSTGFVDNAFNTNIINPTGVVTADKVVYSGAVRNEFSQNSDTLFTTLNTSTGASARSGLFAGNAATGGTFGVAASTYTDRPILANRMFIEAGGSTDGIVLNNTGSDPIVFGIASTEVARITPGGAVNVTGLTASSAVATDGSKNLVSVANTGTGSNVLATSPTLVTPNLGTPSAVNLANGTNLPIANTTGNIPVTRLNSGTSASSSTFWRGDATWAAPTATATPGGSNTQVQYNNAGVLGGITGATSSGTGLTLVGPAIGTPVSGILTNCTGTAAGLTAGTVTTNANLTGAITSSGNATSLGSFTSAALATALTDETGTGANVFATSPTLVTPILGTPTSGTLTNTTGFPAANLAGLGTGVATFLATPTSANLAAAVTGETGTGAVVFGTAPTITTPSIIGVTSGAAASASEVGEFLSTTIPIGSAVSLTTATTANVGTLVLTAGDWDVWGSVVSNNGATITDFQVGTSLTSVTLPAVNSGAYSRWIGSATANLAQTTGRLVVNVSTSTTVYLTCLAQFTGGTLSVYGFIGARRIR